MFKMETVWHENYKLSLLKSTFFDSTLKTLFTTRLGGDTPKPLQSFTLSSKDYPLFDNYAQKNLRIICNILQAPFENLIMPNQQHTDKIAIIKTKEDIRKVSKGTYDGIVTNLKNHPVCLVFADCVPILMYDERKQVMACVHAGWKGTAKFIAPKAAKIMQDEFGCDLNDIKVEIGPAICQNCFEVSPDVADQLGMSGKIAYGNIFLRKNNKINVDLKQLNKHQLNAIGIENIDVSPICTCCQNTFYYSYRADNQITGRHGLIAMIKE